MNITERLDQRWRAEIHELEDLAARSHGRLSIRSATGSSVRLELECIAAFHHGSLTDAPKIGVANHQIKLVRAENWPAEQVSALHEGPPGIWHPNILGGLNASLSEQPVVAMQQIAGALHPGLICYGSARPGLRLVDIVQQIYNILGYRYGAYARRHEHLNLPALQWVNQMLATDPAFFPLERRPLITKTGVEHARPLPV